MKKKKATATLQDREPNFRDPSGKLYLIRCFACNPTSGRENWGPAVATGACAWCSWPALKEPKNGAK